MILPEKSDKIVITADTSALISLSVGKILEFCLELFDIVIPTTVHEELKDISGYKDEHAQAAISVLKLISESKIKVLKIDEDKAILDIVGRNSKLDRGEVETLFLAKTISSRMMITDDFRSLEGLKLHSGDVKIHLSIYPIARLVVQGTISKKKAEETLEKIADERSWEGAALFRFAKKYIDEL